MTAKKNSMFYYYFYMPLYKRIYACRISRNREMYSNSSNDSSSSNGSYREERPECHPQTQRRRRQSARGSASVCSSDSDEPQVAKWSISEYDSDGKPCLYTCRFCPRQTKREGDMVRHLESIKHQAKAYYCNCRSSFTRIDALMRHIRRSRNKTLHRVAK